MSNKTIDTLLTGIVFTCLVCIFSFIYTIGYGDYGGTISLVHVVIMSVAYLTIDPRYAIAAGIGTLIGEMILDTMHFGLPIFIISFLEYLVISLLLKRSERRFSFNVFSLFGGAIVIAFGIPVADWLLTLNLDYFFVSLLYNAFQGVASVIIVLVLIPFYDLLKEYLPQQLEVNK